MEYTKGEWYLEQETGLILSVPEGEDVPVVIVNVGKSGGVTPKTLSELEANANLIASAPDLYEACKLTDNTVIIKTEEGYLITSDALRKIKKALAKAEGK